MAIFVSEKSTEFRDHCETESDLALLDHFCVIILGKKIVNLDRQEFIPELRNKDLFIVPKSWEQQYKALEKHYRALAKNGINRGVTYARKITRMISARESTNKESKFSVYSNKAQKFFTRNKLAHSFPSFLVFFTVHFLSKSRFPTGCQALSRF